MDALDQSRAGRLPILEKKGDIRFGHKFEEREHWKNPKSQSFVEQSVGQR